MEQQYLQLLQDILDKGQLKPAAREGMPGTLSLFGYQMRHNLQEGFPLLTTKKVSFKNIVVELLWFLKGDTNIKFLVNNRCNIWNEDAYNYYEKLCKKQNIDTTTFEGFIDCVNHREECATDILKPRNYEWGDCGKQYGWLWRSWEGVQRHKHAVGCDTYLPTQVDQLKELIEGLKKNPTSRRHIITAWNPATLDDMALNACHAFVQFNCRPLTLDEREIWLTVDTTIPRKAKHETLHDILDREGVPRYYLDCQLYQRSADTILGVPYNTASYSLLTMVFAELLNMLPGEFIHTFGDVHIYENHLEATKEQLQREPRQLPTVRFSDEFKTLCKNVNHKDATAEEQTQYILDSIRQWDVDLFILQDYNPHPKLQSETKLSTGLR